MLLYLQLNAPNQYFTNAQSPVVHSFKGFVPLYPEILFLNYFLFFLFKDILLIYQWKKYKIISRYQEKNKSIKVI
jgi:hypothetical protein